KRSSIGCCVKPLIPQIPRYNKPFRSQQEYSQAMFDLFRSRDKAVRIILTALLGLVALSMVTYLIPSSGTDTGNTADRTVVASVGKDDLTSQQVSRVIQNMTRNRQLPSELLAIYDP